MSCTDNEPQAMKIEQFEQVVSESFRDSSSGHGPTSDVTGSIDLALFWDIIEASFSSERPVDPYFGSSLLSHHRQEEAGDRLGTRPLPEPTHIETIQQSDRTLPSSSMQPGIVQGSPSIFSHELPILENETSILAQSYFAQGEDFAGGLDDWWFTG
jgi:hypothetical protein